MNAETTYRRWTEEDLNFIRENSARLNDYQIAEALNRSPQVIAEKRRILGSYKNRPWTQEEIDYLTENWGTVSLPSICKHLGRSRNAVEVKKNKLGLGAFLESGEYVTFNALLQALGYGGGYTCKTTSWVQNRGMPIKTKLVGNNRFRIIYISDFWKWAEKNRSFIDFSKMEPLSLGEEPHWVESQRKLDFYDGQNYRKDPWSDYEDEQLKHLLKQFKHGYLELSKMIGRSAGAIQRRICDLGLRERPIKADNHNEWSQSDFDTLADMIRNGYSYGAIGEVLGRSEKAIRGRVYDFYRTENADKVRKMLGSGPWGTGKPELTVKDAKRKVAVKNDLTRLQELLLFRRNQLGYEPYWQRHMCMNWHDIKGCGAGCANCDDCIAFKRIEPQYCVRCGVTFFEGEKVQICKRCRQARRKQHLKKVGALFGGKYSGGKTA